jgi:hypothetical protein
MRLEDYAAMVGEHPPAEAGRCEACRSDSDMEYFQEGEASMKKRSFKGECKRALDIVKSIGGRLESAEELAEYMATLEHLATVANSKMKDAREEQKHLMPRVGEATRELLRQKAAQHIAESYNLDMDDGYSGVNIRGSSSMTDEELIDFMLNYDSDARLIEAAVSEMSADAMLKNLPIPEFDLGWVLRHRESELIESDIKLSCMRSLLATIRDPKDRAAVQGAIDARTNELLSRNKLNDAT